MHFLHRWKLVWLLCLVAVGCTESKPVAHPTTAPSAYREADEIKTALTYLASDQLEGRGLQTQGINKAADFIATQFRKDGLQTFPDFNGYFQDFPIDVSRVRSAHDRRTFHNVIAYLPGKGEHMDEFIVVGAHYDHLGRGEIGSLAPNAHQIHHGADDNASGTTAVLELAEELSRHGPLDRSVIFACFVGEERGLLGSLHFVSHPPVPLDEIVAMVNMDMVGRVKNNTIFVGGNGTAKDFDKLLAKADEDSPLTIKNAGTDVGGRGGIGPSDHMSFAMKKIPVIFLWSGMHRDYHRPTDTADKINYLGEAEVVDLCENIVRGLADLPREQYVDTYDKHSMGMGGIKVRLGIMPDYSPDPNVNGVRIAGTSPDAPASKAGLREGDIITAIDSDKIASLGDYMTVLGKHKPGDVIKIVIERDKQRVELSATLSDPKG